MQFFGNITDAIDVCGKWVIFCANFYRKSSGKFKRKNASFSLLRQFSFTIKIIPNVFAEKLRTAIH